MRLRTTPGRGPTRTGVRCASPAVPPMWMASRPIPACDCPQPFHTPLFAPTAEHPAPPGRDRIGVWTHHSGDPFNLPKRQVFPPQDAFVLPPPNRATYTYPCGRPRPTKDRPENSLPLRWRGRVEVSGHPRDKSGNHSSGDPNGACPSVPLPTSHPGRGHS